MALATSCTNKMQDQLGGHLAELRLLADRLQELTVAEREGARHRLLRRLRAHVDEHSELHGRVLYPDVADRLGDPLSNVSLNYDLLAIHHWMEQIAAVDASDTRRLQRLLYELNALLRVYIWKEDELFLALLESSRPHGLDRTR
jgi:hypothetical protein